MKTLANITLILLLFAGTAVAQNSANEKAVLEALEQFHTSIVENDSEAASKVLHENVLILEGTGMETKKEYLSHHFHSDGQFLSAMNRELITQEISVEGNTAWVSTVSSLKGTYSEKEMDITSLELAVLKKDSDMWRIVAVHWSSR